MGYIEGYSYDIFISYSHIDNEEPVAKRKGWVEKFYDELKVLLMRSTGTRDISIWWDRKRLEGNTVFDKAIAEGIKETAILICLNSPSYLNSDYCKLELDVFNEHAALSPHGLTLRERSRILNVLLFNIHYSQWPKAFSGTTGFSFYDAEQQEELGDRYEIPGRKFKTALQDLRDAVTDLIKEFKKAPPPVAPEKDFSIYFGDVSDGLDVYKGKTIKELQKKGYKIHSDIPPPFDSAGHENAVIQRLKTSHLNVHLLDNLKGRKIVGDELIGFPQKQLELSLQVDNPKLIWVPEETDFNSVEDETYKDFLIELDTGGSFSDDTSYIRGKKSTLVKEIMDLAEMLKDRQKQSVAVDKLAVLLDTHRVDQLTVQDLYKNLVVEHIKPLLNPEEGDPLKNIQALEETIRQVRKLVFYYGEVSEQWIKERFNAARQFLARPRFPEKEFLVFLMPPLKNPDAVAKDFQIPPTDVFDNSTSAQLQLNIFRKFLERIKA